MQHDNFQLEDGQASLVTLKTSPTRRRKRLREATTAMPSSSYENLVVRDRFLDIAFQPMHGQIHLSQPDRCRVLFQPKSTAATLGSFHVVQQSEPTARTFRPSRKPDRARCQALVPALLEINATRETGVKNSPSSWAFWSANCVREYS